MWYNFVRMWVGTIKYYNDNAEKFYKDTISGDMKLVQDIFLKYLNKKAYILDHGCGAGRDTKYFILRGYTASRVTGIKVKNIMA